MQLKENKLFDILEKVLLIVAFVAAVVGSSLYLYMSEELFVHFGVAVTFFVIFLATMAIGIAFSFLATKENSSKARILNGVASAIVGLSGLLIIIFQLVVDFFQPLAIFAPPVVCLVVFLVAYFASGILGLFKKNNSLLVSLVGLGAIGIILTNVVWANTQGYAEFNEDVPSTIVMAEGEGKYSTYRIPTLMLADGRGKDGKDALAIFTEARCHTAKDNSESELVMKVSMDSGETFTNLQVVLTPTELLGEVGRIADPTPVYDSVRDKIAIIFMACTASSGYKFKTYYMEGVLHEDGSVDWDKANIVCASDLLGYAFSAGPSKGSMLSDGTLAFPIRSEGNNYVLYTKDGGKSFTRGAAAGAGGETDMTMLSDTELFMITRRGNMSEFPRNNHLHFIHSSDNGASWDGEFKESNLRTPIVMSSVAAHNGVIYTAYCDSYRTRANLSYAVSTDKGATWTTTPLYSGASGYAVGDISDDGMYYIVAEMGKIEYHEEIRLFFVNVA